MGQQPVLRPTGNDTFIVSYAASPAGDDFDFADALALSRKQETQKDFEAACNTRLHSFQRLVELIPDEGETILEWEDDNSQAAMLTGYCSGIDHFLAGDWEMAAAILEMLLELDPEDHLEATMPLAYTYLAMEEFESFDEIINDVNDKHIDKVILTLWSGFLRSGSIAEGEMVRLKNKFAPYHAEFVADTHPVTDAYLTDIKSEHPSKEALARELWLQTEHLWTLFPKFIKALRKA
jgi:hypothetical protein